jgi:hypothetical protein
MELHSKYGPGIFGKIAQKLLALSFHASGYNHIVERSVEGVDIDVSNGESEKMAIEVKTTEGYSFPLSQSNIDALRMREVDQYRAIIAAIRLAPLEKWIISNVNSNLLKPGQIPIESLRPNRLNSLGEQINSAFDKVVEEHYSETLSRGLAYLTERLRDIGIKVEE